MKKIEVTIQKIIYKLPDEQVVQKALQEIADMFTANELQAIAVKLKNPVVQMQIRSML